MNTAPRISVIVPTYNRAAMVCSCVRSILASDWANFEVIVADDCSPDDTQEAVKRMFADDARVKYTRTLRNSLTSGARNQGVRIATGDYYFWHSDNAVKSTMPMPLRRTAVPSSTLVSTMIHPLAR